MPQLPPAARAADAEAAAGRRALRALRPEATRLPSGRPSPPAPLRGRVAGGRRVQPLLFVNPRSMEVERFMRSCGLGRPEGTNEPLDHVATECEPWSTCPARGRRPGFRGAPADADLPGGARRRLRGLPLRARPSLDASLRRAPGRRGAPSLLRGGGPGGAGRLGRCQTGRFQPSFREPLTR
ncbi:MAG: molecular chaperone TorD family protein [Eggerthella lenta]